MIIPAASAVVINGVNYASLILATALGNAGVKVLIADSGNTLPGSPDTILADEYGLAFLKSIGIKVSGGISFTDLFNQSKSMLANQLCTILWETQIGKTSEADNETSIWLSSARGIIEHKTRLVIEGADLLIADTNSTIRYIANYYWKLEGVLNNYIHASILLHQPVEKKLLEDFYMSRKSIADKLKTLFTGKSNEVFHIRESKLSLHLSQNRDIEAGDLLPNMIVYDEKKKRETSFYEWCQPGMFCMLMMGQLSQENLFNVAKWVQANFPLYLFYLPPTERNQNLFDRFNIIEGEKKTLIIRPDRYIGLINDRIDLEIVDNYLTNFIRFETKFKPLNNKLLGQGSIENYP